jgi:hypothetical protein
LASGQSLDVIGSFHLEALPEVDGADKGSITKSERGSVRECKMTPPDSPEPRPLKPVRQFYREQRFIPSSPVTDKLSFTIPQGRPFALQLVVHQGYIQLSCLWSFFSCALFLLLFLPLQSFT